ncbi:MAG: CHAT domain-containing protein [bacterium]
MKKYIPGILLLAIVAATTIWWFNRQPTLVELQKRCLYANALPEAEAQAEGDKIVAQLEEYYLHLPVPDTLRRRVDQEVATMLDTTKINFASHSNGVNTEANPYQLEVDLQKLLQTAAIAGARGEQHSFQELMSIAKGMAQSVDAGKQTDYWGPFVEQFRAFDRVYALTWLKAKKADLLCWQYQDSNFNEAECYGALSLQFLQKVKDEYIHLAVIHFLQYILYQHRSMYELSTALSRKGMLQADRIKYYTCSTGFLYQQAEALAAIGENQEALPLYDAVLDNVNQYKNSASMQWFSTHGLLGRGRVYLELGQFENALKSCAAVEQHLLGDGGKIRLMILRGYVYAAMAKYEHAEEELQKAIRLAEAMRDTFDLIGAHNNLGMMFERLTEYDLALDHYYQAKALFTTKGPNISQKLIVLNNIADILADKNNLIQFDEIIQETKKLLQEKHVPYQEMLLLRNIGSMYKRQEKFDKAILYYEQAVALCDENGLLRYSLGANIDIVDCLIGLSKFDDAQSLVSKTMSSAEEIEDVQRLIDATGRAAKIQFATGKIAQARASSNRLLRKIETLSASFNNFDRLTAYHQKIYDLLKNAAYYEIAFQRPDSALIKLDYAKAYALKSRLRNGQSSRQQNFFLQKYLSIDSVRIHLQKNSLLINYLITEDTLFAFVLDQNGLQLLSKKLTHGAAGLRKSVAAYQEAIVRTIAVFQQYETAPACAHYSATTALGQELYEDLFGWPTLARRLQQAELLYIVPDEFLHAFPFATLPVPNSIAGTFLTSLIAVSILPSAEFLQNEHSLGVPKELLAKKVVIAADQRFPGVTEFVAKVKELFPLAEELMIEKDALTKGGVLARLKNNYTIFIFVGHGSANEKYPDLSYIELSVKTANVLRPETGLDSNLIQLSLADLKEIKWLDAEMVMLIGCQTARGKLYRGTGMSGLLQGFLSLGAENVLGNLWEVDASHAIAQAQDFLTLWAASRHPVQALQKSQLKAILALAGNSYYQQPHPYFWGSSILSSSRPL